MSCFVYLIRRKDGSLYTGITWSLKKRINEHNFGNEGFTKSQIPVELVYYERFRTRKEAARREKEIKGWRREKKEKLIALPIISSSLP